MSHIYIETAKLKGWRAAMADWDKGGDAALAEMDDVLASQAEAAGYTLAALSAIYHDAHRRGYRAGFETGVGEKLWLHKHWPLIGMALSFATMVAGFALGAWA